MFFIFNKPKIYSYLIVLSTVVVLFFTASVLSEANNLETLTTSSTETDFSKTIENVGGIKQKKVAITLNCLETDKNIEEILNCLDKYEVKLNFCLYGDWVKKYPELVKKIDERGHCIINMSDSYKDLTSVTPEEAKKLMTEGENKLRTLLNKEIKLFRCPYGKYNEEIMSVANENGYKVIGWEIDSLDYQGIEGNVMWENIKNKFVNGSIVSMNSNSEHILEGLELIIKSLKEREYEVITIEGNIDC